MERVQEKDLSINSTWEAILNANVLWGSTEHGNRIQALTTAKLAKTLQEAGQSADTLNRKIYWLNWLVLAVGVIQLRPIIREFNK